MALPLDVGFYGKLPSHGDFLRRRTSDAFVAVWDGWLQDCLAASRSALGDRWLELYLTSPAWRFVCGAGACGVAPVAGVMVPSVDRVGRYFPLTLVAELPAGADVLAVAAAAEPFMTDVERLAIDTLEAEAIDLEAFDEHLRASAARLAGCCTPPPVSLDPSAAGILDGDGETAVQMAVGSPPRLAPVLLQVLAHRLAAVYEPLTLWWTDGSAAVEPSGLICRGLPDPESFASLLDGAWTGRRWWAIPSHAVDPAPEDESPGADEGPVTLRSAAASDAGRVRAINQDAFLERPDLGIWVVADGLGGHADGEIASRMVCDAFAGLGGEPTLEALIEAGTERLHQVNGHLVRAALRSRDGARSGSTVAALLVRGSRLAAVWAGDSRVYRWRDGQLAQVTRDHNLAAAGETLETGDANVVTRAVGGENTLELDVRRDRARPGDRYLLCSDGLTRTVPDSRIESWMASGDAPAVVRGLVDAALAAGAPDNVTVVVVDVSP